MATYVRGFLIPEVVDVHSWFQRCLRDAEKLLTECRHTDKEVMAQDLLDTVTLAYNTFNKNLAEAAEVAAAGAMVGMKERLNEHERPSAGSSPPAADLVIARPLSTGSIATGMVGVGDVAWLRRIINRQTGYGTYWRALEYGTGQHGVPSQVGRILLGVFGGQGGTDANPPQAQYAGGRGPHPVFLSKSKLGEGTSKLAGFGTIRVEMRGKHFIEYGADAAAVKWREDIAAAQERAVQMLDDIKL